MVDYLCYMGAFSKSIFTHVYIGFNIICYHASSRVVPHISPETPAVHCSAGGTQGSRAIYVVLPSKKRSDDFITSPPKIGP